MTDEERQRVGRLEQALAAHLEELSPIAQAANEPQYALYAGEQLKLWRDRCAQTLLDHGLEQEAEMVRGEPAIFRNTKDRVAIVYQRLHPVRVDMREHPEHWLRKMSAGTATQTGTLSIEQLHPFIHQASAQLFLDGHYARSVEEAFKAVNVHVRQRAGQGADGGVGMMHVLFALQEPQPGKPRLRLNDLQTQTDRDEQEGFQHIFAGAQQAIRNVHAHNLTAISDARTALEFLTFASLLARTLDRARLDEV